jgi:aquaporin Z
MNLNLKKRCMAEFLGTLWLVLGGCGSAGAASFTGTAFGDKTWFPLGIGFTGVSIAFGLTVLTGIYALGRVSGGHFNPAVSFGLWAGKRFSGSELLPYIVSQVLGAIVAAGIIYLVASGGPDFSIDPNSAGTFATNGFGKMSPGGFPWWSCLITEVVLTFFFLIVILGSTDRRSPAGFAGIAIGLALTLIHLISIPITNTSVNPARSLGPALFAGGPALSQVWFFWVFPILGALLAGWVYSSLFEEESVREEQELATTSR